MGNSTSRKKAAFQRKSRIQSKALQINEASSEPRFVADVMLGRLAKWLRIAGFDVLYSNRYADDELIALSSLGNRILLSRDTRLLVRRSVSRFIFLESEKILEQIRQVFCATGVESLPALLSRCLSCNRILTDVPREKARELVPPFVFETQSRFKSCSACGRIYWAGTHRRAVLRTLESILNGTHQDTKAPR
jgi:uncharacterized protein with PIN domain